MLEFAAAELARVLQRMGGSAPPVRVQAVSAQLADGLWLGLLPDFGMADQFRGSDPALDDQVFARVTDGAGLLAGSNPRSLLLAVYRFLGAAGCRWVRPGPEGEIIPARDPHSLTIQFDETAGSRQRAICLESAASLKNVLDLVDWAPKLGFSGYFLQLRDGFPDAGTNMPTTRTCPPKPSRSRRSPATPVQSPPRCSSTAWNITRPGLAGFLLPARPKPSACAIPTPQCRPASPPR